MAKVRDLVCGMMVDPETAPARATFEGKTYHFCTLECRDQFEARPAHYVARAQTADADFGEEEKHEQPFTKKGPIVSPKYGSAGSGGLEFEPGPERHRPER